MVSIEIDKIVPIYSRAILHTEKNVVRIAGGSKEGFKPEARKFIIALQRGGKGKVLYLWNFVEEVGCDKRENNQM